MNAASLCALGFLLGLKHALESDHVIAVSTIAAEERSALRAMAMGLSWGLGHTATLLVAGLAVLGLRLSIPERLGLSLELVVGLVLVVLGVDLLQRLGRERLHAHWHEHGGRSHLHFHRHAAGPLHEHRHPRSLGKRALLVGAIHGLAGSAALMLVVLGTVSDARLGLLYVLLFGAGSIAGMGLVSLVLGVFFAAAVERLGAVEQWLRLSLGALSTGFGCWIVAELAPRVL